MAGAALTTRPNGNGALSQRDPIQLAEHFAKSGYFKDARDLSQAVVKIVAGEELGIGPMGSMQGIHLIEGKPSLSANLLASLVKRHPAYDYRVREHTAEVCRIAFLQDGEEVGLSEFSIDEAKQAGVYRQNWQKYPKAMLFARALSQGVRWFAPDVTAGSPAYVPEELGAEVTEEGEPVAVETGPAGAVTGTAAEVAAKVAEEAEQDAQVVELDPERVERIYEAIRALGLKIGQIDLLLGAAGLDALRARSKQAVEERIKGLTDEEADRLEAELNREADR